MNHTTKQLDMAKQSFYHVNREHKPDRREGTMPN